MTRVGAIDCGTNTVKLLVTDLDPATGAEQEVLRESRMVRLGQGVDRTGRLADEAMARAFAALEEYADLLARHPVTALRFCATSATRDAENATEFSDGVERILGVRPEVVTGEEEAGLSFDGATRSLGETPGPIVVLDIGGGSTEVILGDGPGRVRAARSLDIGSVRMTERYLHTDPPTDAEIQDAIAFVDAQLDTLLEAGIDLAHAGTVVAVSGTGLTVAAAVLDLPGFDRAAVHHARVSVTGIHDAAERLLSLTTEQRRALPFMHPGRADVIAAGGLILDRILARTDVEALTTSVADILDGIAWSLV